MEKTAQERLARGGRKTTEEYSASAAPSWDNSEGKYGPFLSSDSHLRLQARAQDDLMLHDTDVDDADVHYIEI